MNRDARERNRRAFVTAIHGDRFSNADRRKPCRNGAIGDARNFGLVRRRTGNHGGRRSVHRGCMGPARLSNGRLGDGGGGEDGVGADG
jgi:hypothetical protein